MAFIDEITISAEAGKGGDGVARFLHLKGKEKAGPSGGNGGRGGDVIVRATRDLNILFRYRGAPTFKAHDGQDGMSKEMYGAHGKSVVIFVPLGSKVTIHESNRTFELLGEDEEVVVLQGGDGGLGNAHFKSSTNQYPTQTTAGKMGEKGTLHIEVELIADVGLVGLPNAGKSSLLNTFTDAHSKVAAYPFTTLEPHLGVFHNYVIADIPGLIEGASDGRGLGHKFLRHIKRTRVILHCIPADEESPSRLYEKVRNELEKYSQSLAQKPEIIFLTKADTVSEDEFEHKKKELEKWGKVVPFSILDDSSIKTAQEALVHFLRNHI
jgi:GTPase